VLPACQGYGLGVLPWSPLHGGLLGGILDKQTNSYSPESRPTADSPESRPTATGRRADGRAVEALTKFRPQVEEYDAFCAELGEPPAAVALAWLLHQPAVTAPIIGPRTRDQLAAPLRAADLDLGAKELARLDEIFPGPGPAPPAPAQPPSFPVNGAFNGFQSGESAIHRAGLGGSEATPIQLNIPTHAMNVTARA
jgi:aryl-alcohol dehydrogenase-like predicted oxidoreductase